MMTDTNVPVATGDRLAKVMARAGLCSRRDAEEWIRAGRVTVNGQKIVTPAFNVSPSDKVVVDGTPLADRQGTRVWLYHKPAGLVVTARDPEGRPTIFEALEAKGLPRVVSVGRLDINTEGLLLLTNDGGLKRILELPATGWLRKYRVRAHGTITQAQLDSLQKGTEIGGVKYGSIEATLEREQGSNVWIEVSLREGKNREVKNVLGALGLEVNRLIRVSFGPFQLGDLPEGEVEVVKARVLKEQLGKRLATAAEADFESAMPETEGAVERRPLRRGRPPASTGRGGAGRRPETQGKTRAGRPERTMERGARSSAGGGARTPFTKRRTEGVEGPRRAGGPERAPRSEHAGHRDERRRPGPPRRVFFDDGRAPEKYEEKSERSRDKGPATAGERHPPRGAGPRTKPAGAAGTSARPA
jgi:23S rRNA pseudouridine2605 synthase